MATWDGSYSGSGPGAEDQNYYVYSDQNASASTSGNRIYFSNNIGNNYMQSNGDFYVQNTRLLINNYEATNLVDNNQVLWLRPQRYLPKAIKSSQQCYVPENSLKHDSNPRRSKVKHNFKGPKETTGNGASHKLQTINSASDINSSSRNNSGSSDKYFSHGNGHEKKYNNKKDFNYKPRHGQQGHSGFKDCKNESKTEIKVKGKSNNDVFKIKKKGVHWRSKRDIYERNYSQKRRENKKSLIDDDANQRERLTDQLNRSQLECLVCCENIKPNDYVWSCSNCYHVLHLKCIKRWAKSSQTENGWRCPACRNMNLVIPEDYFCFCGKTKAPKWNRRDVAHSCGVICGRTLSKNNCPHKCTLLCHPGSCPQCTAMVTRYCGCGRTSRIGQCGTNKLLLCNSVCGKDLNCGRHKCENNCHYGVCANCEKIIATQLCCCGKNTRIITCEISDVSFTYFCETVCGKLLECSNHICEQLCHPDACEPCPLCIDKVTTGSYSGSNIFILFVVILGAMFLITRK